MLNGEQFVEESGEIPEWLRLFAIEDIFSAYILHSLMFLNWFKVSLIEDVFILLLLIA